MGKLEHYVIRGGLEGRERLRVLARVMHDTSTSLLDRLGLRNGLACLDVGCGGGDVTLELARRVAPGGKVVGVDLDEAKLEMARQEARERGVANVEFRLTDVREMGDAPQFDVVYARFLLTHLSDPAGALGAFCRHVRPGGLVAIEDIDFSGCLTYPGSQAHQRFFELYCSVVRQRGGDPNIGPRLPLLLKDCGLEAIGVTAVQPIGVEGEVKLIDPLTMENIAEAVLQDGLATREEIEQIVCELYAFAADPATVAGVPRVVQSWGRRPAG